MSRKDLRDLAIGMHARVLSVKDRCGMPNCSPNLLREATKDAPGYIAGTMLHTLHRTRRPTRSCEHRCEWQYQCQSSSGLVPIG